MTPNSATENHERWMRRCLQLARCGQGHAAPNPMVGAVIVHEGRIIGEGYHIRCGEAHAEVNAIRSVRPADRALLRQSTLYVSLEPCAHFGRTPPCARLIVSTGIPHVVVGCIDPFAKVQGRGITLMREAGIDVTVGVCEQECLALNRRCITFQTLGRPYITLKWAESNDGYIDRLRDGGRPALLSTPRTLMHVHYLRATHSAILVGHRTLTVDHPQLNVRYWAGNHPVRIVLGHVTEAELPPGFEAYADIHTALQALHSRGLQSLLVEGGSLTLQSFIDRDLWDEAWVEHSALRLEAGVPAPLIAESKPHADVFLYGVRHTHYHNHS